MLPGKQNQKTMFCLNTMKDIHMRFDHGQVSAPLNGGGAAAYNTIACECP